MCRKKLIDKKKSPTESANFQPSLFDNSVIEHTAIYKFIVPHFAKNRKRKRRKRRKMNTYQIQSRQFKGNELAKDNTCFDRYSKEKVITSSNGKTEYKVDLNANTCTCPDFTYRRETCKHLYAARIRSRVEKPSNVTEMPSRPQYAQNWTAYNKAQTSEKHVFLGLLSELTRDVAELENETGRPSLNLGDMIFASIFKVYSQMSARRFTVDLKDAAVKGYIGQAPHYNSLLRYFERESLTPYLESLVEATAKPLASLETDFAVDSTGLSISNQVSWHHAKHKDVKQLQNRNWIKIHCAVGTRTNVITAVDVTDKTSNDTLHFTSVLEATRKNFKVESVSGDKAYNSMTNFDYAAQHGLGVFIPFKSHHSAIRYPGKRFSTAWTNAFHYFNLHRSEFLQNYGKRSNIEAAFGALKAKFGGTLKSKTFSAQKNEALCKVICHNISCLIHAMNEFGITPDFLC